ncbi:ammonium transporter [Methanococcus maripaludis]|uniref:Amt family ammonium transporter n=1 Tax=Methanococcus maripaludis TaxID=39152 RepID=A0A7J9PUD1_METMI|nr:ammonium transporter [Methanococcus maripaludis]MBA2869369.1 Amt family ammonium transporter [Methanococcus maripaludis]
MVTADLFNNPTNIMDALNTLANSSDVMFLIFTGAFIFIMHLGFAMLEGGQVREKNVNNAMMKNMGDWIIGCISWLLVGSVIARTLNPADFFIWWGKIASATPFLSNNGLELANWFLGLVFAATAATIVAGGIAERIKFKSYILISIVITALLYPFFSYLGPWGAGVIPFHDYAGSLMVHGVGGFLALGLIAAIGPRVGRFVNKKAITIPGHNIPMSILGAYILAFGWYGFNVGSSLALSDISGLVCATTTLAMAGGGLGGCLFSKNDVLYTANGLLAGTVAICAGTDIVSPLGALIIGFIAGSQVPLIFKIVEKLGLDDVCGVIPVHATSGALGAILAGIFGMTAFGGVGGVSLTEQIIATLICAIYGTGAGFILGKLVGAVTGGLRVKESEEKVGLDISIHKLPAYPKEN